MFWGLILKANKKYSQTVTKAFHLSQCTLDQTTCGDDDVQVMLNSEGTTYLLCTLKKNKVPQWPLDLNFAAGDKIKLSTNGNGTVHLAGYLIPDEEDLFDMDDGEEVEDEEEDQEVEVAKNGVKKERVAKLVAKKLTAKEVNEEEQSEDDADETFDLSKAAAAAAAEAASEEEESDSDEDDEAPGVENNEEEEDSDDDDEEDDDEDDSDEEIEEPKAKVAKVEKKSSKQNGVENGKATPKEQKQTKVEAASPKSKILQGGLVVEDLKVGQGKEATNGKKVQVYYEGRLKKTNKTFDATKNGPGFKFALGRGEVIRGWDVGVAGMKVGGKRRITCPPALAYGNKGSPPVIPPNSTLVFDVELKNVF